MRRKSVCEKCGLNHKVLGVTIKRGALHRRVTRENQIGRQGGGFWAFDLALIEHHPEIRRLFVFDETSGDSYEVERDAFDKYAVRQNLGVKPQFVLYFRHWRIKRGGDESSVESSSAASSAAAVVSWVQSRFV